jgi:hypothetical protein
MTHKAVFGVVENEAAANRVVEALVAAHIPTSFVSVLFPSAGATRDFAVEKGTKAPEGAIAGGATGGALGGTLGLLAGLGLLAIPGIGPLVAAGPLMAALSGVAVGATVGSIAGGLIGLGIPELQAKLYETRVREGKVLISVHTIDGRQVDVVKNVLEREGATEIAAVAESKVRTEPLPPRTLAG